MMNEATPNNPGFSHLREGQPAMVDITGKAVTGRTAIASARVDLSAVVMGRFRDHELHGPKGPVFQTAIIAGTMAAKKTGELIPFCHPLPVENCVIVITPDAQGVVIRCEVSTTGKTGVEMEAMTGASVAALTIYDMCKALDKSIRIREVKLISKTGGKSGDYQASDEPDA